MSEKINILFIGDIIGEPGYNLTATILPSLVEKHKIDFTIANCENLTDGKGISQEDANKIFNLKIDVLTTGNHVWDRWDSGKVLGDNKNILRPMNYPSENAGSGFGIFESKNKIKVAVMNAQGRTFMQPIDDPFKSIDFALKRIGSETKIIILDFHAEATAEKIALAWFLDGKISALLGTHTHTPTADARIFPRQMAYISDVGMSGPYDSVIGMKKESAVRRFIRQTPMKYETATNDVHLCGVVLKIDIETGKTEKIEQIIYPEFK